MKMAGKESAFVDSIDTIPTISPSELIIEAGRNFGLKLKKANRIYIELDELYLMTGRAVLSSELSINHMKAKVKALEHALTREFLANPNRRREEVRRLFDSGIRKVIFAPQAD